MTVRDLVSGVIESQLKRTDPHSLSASSALGSAGMGTGNTGTGSPICSPGPSESPTIQSILQGNAQRNYAVSMGRNSAPLTISVTNASSHATPPPRPLFLGQQQQQLTGPDGPKPAILILDSSTVRKVMVLTRVF